ncbi:hypothetical protein ANCCAN_27199 [Ancylostoma caninum]|uniref:Peptidase C13 family protein n=1 Tax=Ancylostoma caninum TaxID=29170 RepID=A0A368F656_ANCCA|nr:hypothetical protein ANCCAN_27199 [Ancylostoma caninum]
MSSIRISLFLLSILAFACYALPQPKFLNDPPQSIHAILVAGSNGINNYRHQADVAHAYHLLIEKGVPAENIVTMMYDDVALDPSYLIFEIFVHLHHSLTETTVLLLIYSYPAGAATDIVTFF